MSAPTRAAHYWDHGTSEAGYPARKAAGWLVDGMASLVGYFPDWLWGGVAIDLTRISHDAGKSCAIGFAGGTVNGILHFSADPSGWVLVRAEIGGVEMFRGYMDRPWEQYEIWPPGAAPAKDDEGPGRMGKKQVWVGLDPVVWPSLGPLADAAGNVMFEVDDQRLRDRMARDDTRTAD